MIALPRSPAKPLLNVLAKAAIIPLMDGLTNIIVLLILAWVLISPGLVWILIKRQKQPTTPPTAQHASPPTTARIHAEPALSTTPPEKPDNSALSDSELLTKIRSLSPRSFEYYTAEVFKRLGYKTFVTPQHRDNGIDVILHKSGTVSYIQCKKYINKTVGVGEVRDFYGAIVDKLADGVAIFVTTNIFTEDAKKFVRGSKNSDQIQLIDCQRLISCIRLIERSGPQIPFTNLNDFKAPSCPTCKGGRLVKRQNKNNGTRFYGCSNYPSCKYARSI